MPVDHVYLKPVCFLLSLCHAGFAAAIGLGEISVRSYLGQPLHASVILLGATSATQADCFRLDASPGSIAPPLRAQLSVDKAGEHALLHIRTPQAIHDPIAQFVLVSDCEARLEREYVVLLDPPASLDPVASPALPAVETVSAPAAQSPMPAARPPRHETRASAIAARPATSATPGPAAPRKQQTTAPAQPRLVLSGRHSANTPFALRLDNQLPDLTRPQPENLTATELSDENTALARKIAHLETQLAALQQRNAELEARRPSAPQTVMTPPPPKQPAQWPLYLLAIGLLGGSGAMVAWLRRRRPDQHTLDLPDTGPWTQQPDDMPAASVLAQSEATPAPQRMPEIAQPPHEEGTEVKEDILDQAEVFMAHGHGDLAVHLLQEHLREAPTESPVPWLLLLDLLHRAGDSASYSTASAECRRYFNVNLSGYPVSQDNETGLGLEAYPHLLEQLVKVWNTPDIDAFFNDLVYDHRGGTRIGFEPSAYRDILLLRTIAQQALPLAA